MYKVSHYTEKDKVKLIAFAKENPFAFVTGIGDIYPVTTQLPLEITEEENKIIFSGHMMRKTDHHIAFENNNNVLVAFYSPHAYVDANRYENPAVGSTVNYITVQAKGKILFLDEARTYAAIKQITDKYIGQGTAASFDKISEGYKTTMVKAIAGFRIEVENMEGVFKLSQNMHAADQKSIINHLEKRATPGDIFIAGKMKELLA